jgi:predicted RNA-binding Zn ribbon-like protein
VSTAAPGRLELVRAFVNTRDVEAGTDALATPRELARWLREAGLLAAGDAVGDADLGNAREVREALRTALAANHDAAVIPDDALATMNAAAGRAGLSVEFAVDHRWHYAPTASGADAAVGALLAIALDAMAERTWPRLKICRNDACRWAFYDHSRACTGKWCSMRVCGNRAKQSAWRERHASR